MASMKAITSRIIAAFIMFMSPVSGAVADVLKNIRENGQLKIGYREDAEPFSFINPQGVPDGYSVNLCKAVAESIKSDLGLGKFETIFVKVNSADRFKLVQNGNVDLLCGATTATISRRKIVDFSIPTYVTGSTVMVRRDGPQAVQEMNGRKIGVLAATTTAKGLLKVLTGLSINAEVVPVSTHDEGLAKLQKNEISAYFGDKAILVALLRRNGDVADIGISSRLFSIEPYAIGLPHADTAFRLAVDAALSKIYRSPRIQKIYGQAFADEPLGDLMRSLYFINALPE